MTMLVPEMVVCAHCGCESEQTMVLSSNTLGPPDLDLRPAVMLRDTMPYWVQECPECGHCAVSLDEPPAAAAAAVLASAAYQAQRVDPQFPPLANRFLCQALIHQAGDRPRDAAQAALHAAWACDDAARPASARLARTRAAVDFQRAMEDETIPNAERAVMAAVLLDVLRRAGRTDEAHALCRSLIDRARTEAIHAVLDFQQRLLDQGDDARHDLSEVPGLSQDEPPDQDQADQEHDHAPHG